MAKAATKSIATRFVKLLKAEELKDRARATPGRVSAIREALRNVENGKWPSVSVAWAFFQSCHGKGPRLSFSSFASLAFDTAYTES